MRSAKLTHGGRLLTLTVKGKTTQYVVEDARPDPRIANPAFKLTKEDGESYTVAVTEWGAACTCADCEFRQRLCKHAKSLMATGLIPK